MSQIPPRKSDRSRTARHLQPIELADVMNGPFATFSEWTSEADDKAYAELKARRRKGESALNKSRNR